MIIPPKIKKGDKIAIAAPARKITFNELVDSFRIIENYGYEVVYNDELFASDNQFAGSDRLRAEEIQKYIDDKDIKAILFARGGYGCARIIDHIDFKEFQKHPKWIAGYSDISVFLNHIFANYGVETIHSSMPVNFEKNTKESLVRLFDIFAGKRDGFKIDNHNLNRKGNAKGTLIGGNLSVLYSLIGSNSFPDTKGTILFVEDLDEYLYHVDRMMVAIKRSGNLKHLSGLIVGGMTNMNDNSIPFGETAEEIITKNIAEYDFPVCFGFPSGHIKNNLPLIIGSKVDMQVGSDYSRLIYI